MKVNKIKDLGQGHKIEIGNATWDEEQISIRNRYPTANGGFSPRSSSELPIGDVFDITLATLEEDLIKPKELLNLINAITASIERQVEKV